MAKAKAIKWSIGADEPDDLQEFLSNEDIKAKNKSKFPGRGPWTFKVKRVTMKPNKNGDDRVAVMLVLDEPKKSDAHGWNNYMIMDGFNVVEGPSLSFLKRFLKSLGLTWKDFTERTKGIEEQDRTVITQIGRVKFGEAATKDPTVRATVVVKPEDDYNDDDHMEIKSYLPLKEEVESDEDTDDDDDDTDDDEVATFDEEGDDDDDDDGDDDGDDGDDDDEPELTRDSLKEMAIGDLRDLALEWGVKQKKIDAAGKKKSVLVDLIAKKADIPPF